MNMQSFAIDRPHLQPLKYPARAIDTNFIALCGVACSGKTSIGNALVGEGFPRMPETMRVWMDGVKAGGGNIAELKQADPIGFRRDLFEVAHSIVEQQALVDPTQRMIFNRPGIDALVFMKVDGLDYSRELARIKDGPRFKIILLFDPLPFVADGTRVPDPVLRARQHHAFPGIIAELGYTAEQVMKIPSLLPLPERAQFVLDSLRRRGITAHADRA